MIQYVVIASNDSVRIDCMYFSPSCQVFSPPPLPLFQSLENACSPSCGGRLCSARLGIHFQTKCAYICRSRSKSNLILTLMKKVSMYGKKD